MTWTRIEKKAIEAVYYKLSEVLKMNLGQALCLRTSETASLPWDSHVLREHHWNCVNPDAHSPPDFPDVSAQ